MKKLLICFLTAILTISTFMPLTGCKKEKKKVNPKEYTASSDIITEESSDSTTTSSHDEKPSAEVLKASKQQALQTVDTLFTHIKSGDFENAKSLLLPKINATPDKNTGFDQVTLTRFAQIFSKMEYTVLFIRTTDGETVDVAIEIKALDFKTAFGNFLVKAFEISRNSPTLTPEQLDQKLDKAFNKCITDKSVKTVTSKLTLKAHLIGDTWKIQDTKEFAYAAFGGVISIDEVFEVTESLS